VAYALGVHFVKGALNTNTSALVHNMRVLCLNARACERAHGVCVVR
jgi:hypothetical protein